MLDKNLRAGMRVQIVGNVYDNESIVAFFTTVPLSHRVGTLIEQGVYDEDGWGQRWYAQTLAGRLLVSEADVSPIPDLEPQTTNRGFALREFVDLYGSKCSIQESSLANEGALWLGVDNGGHFNMQSQDWNELAHGKRSTGGRMHLSRGIAAALLPLLTYFVEHGGLPPAGDDHVP